MLIDIITFSEIPQILISMNTMMQYRQNRADFGSNKVIL